MSKPRRDWREILDEVTPLAAERLLEFMGKKKLTPGEYALMKIAQTHIKGMCIYRSETTPGIGTQNNFFIGTPEEAARLIELAKRARELPAERISADCLAPGIIESPAGHSGEDRERPALVAAELHEDI